MKCTGLVAINAYQRLKKLLHLCLHVSEVVKSVTLLQELVEQELPCLACSQAESPYEPDCVILSTSATRAVTVLGFLLCLCPVNYIVSHYFKHL